jgi:hypothetical protein
LYIGGNTNEKNKGVSLMVLVITIIVIIILAGTVILSLSKNNPIDQASEATFKESVSSYSAQLDLYNTTQYATSLGSYNPELLEADSTKATYNGIAISGKPNIYSILTSIKPTDTTFAIKKGKLVYKGSNSNELDWIEEASLENMNRPNLYLIPNPADNSIYLGWNIYDTSQPYLYKAYQQKEGSTDFQSISTSNLKSNVKVLNIYPNSGTNQTFTNWKGVTSTLPLGASLKKWMEEANVDNPKGYGKGLIDVDAVDINVFNLNPSSYMKNPDGSWKYDSIFLGSWNVNGGQDITQVGADLIKKFIQDGRGYLSGHDTVWSNVTATYSRQFRQYTNIKIGSYYEGNYLFPSGDVDFPSAITYPATVYGAQVKICKKGLLTNYPWNIGELNTVLNVPSSHTTSQFAYGDIWLKYDNITDTLSPDGLGTNNYYLTTWNNTAMIQTGHSNGSATADEQKLIANTLFYLSQLTDQTYLDDNSGQDIKAPNAPVINSATINGTTGKVDIVYSASQDLGSIYSYYIEAIAQNDSSVTKTGVKTATITSGIAGYSIVVDTATNTIPPNTVNATALNISLDKPVGANIYVHIKAIDNKGNVSSTTNIKAI